MLLPLFLACQPAPPPPVEVPPEPVAVRDPAPHLALRVFYVMGDKQRSTAAVADQERWQADALAAIRDGEWAGSPRDLLTSAGGGPNGAEWNADADLLVVGHTSLAAPISATLALNGTLAAVDPVVETTDDGHAIVAYRIAQPAWDSALRPIEEPADYLLLFSEEELMPHQPDLAKSPLRWGQILRFQLTVSGGTPSTSRTTEAAFHVAFGE